MCLRYITLNVSKIFTTIFWKYFWNILKFSSNVLNIFWVYKYAVVYTYFEDVLKILICCVGSLRSASSIFFLQSIVIFLGIKFCILVCLRLYGCFWTWRISKTADWLFVVVLFCAVDEKLFLSSGSSTFWFFVSFWI